MQGMMIELLKSSCHCDLLSFICRLLLSCLILQVAKRIVNIRLTIEMHNLRGERFVMFTPYYGFVQYLILNFCQCLFKLKCK